jgi:hypothetical protein
MLANLLVVLPGALLLLLAHGRRGGPEGPVGAHMVTLPLAVAVAVGVGLACAAGPLALLGVPAWVGYASLPGLAVGLCVLPILAFEQQHRLSSRLAVVAGVVGGAGLASAPATGAPGVVAAVAGALVLVPSLFGYGLLVVFWWHQQQNAIAAARADVARQSEFERSQAAWQLGEWQKLPPAPALWQLIQFTHAFHPEVQAECRARIQALPDLDAAMAELLGTGWAEHSLAYLRDAYPKSRAPLAPALATLLDRECEQWRHTLDGAPQPGSWYGNVMKFVQVAEVTIADGGDLRASMERWAAMLAGRPGLGDLADRARAAARG